MQGLDYREQEEFGMAGDPYGMSYGRYDEMSASTAALEYFKQYAREHPEAVTMWAFGLGFVLGWKLRIW